MAHCAVKRIATVTLSLSEEEEARVLQIGLILGDLIDASLLAEEAGISFDSEITINQARKLCKQALEALS